MVFLLTTNVYTPQFPVVYDRSNLSDDSTDVVYTALKEVTNQVFHLRINGTHINNQVIQTNKPEFYLKHDIKGSTSTSGSIFVDINYAESIFSTTCYGHAITNSTEAFSDLKHAYKKEVFNELGEATLATKDKSFTFQKLAALVIRETEVELAEPSLTSKEEVESYLERIQKHISSLLANDVRTPDHLLILVTCSSNLPNQPFRTIVIYGYFADSNI